MRWDAGDLNLQHPIKKCPHWRQVRDVRWLYESLISYLQGIFILWSVKHNLVYDRCGAWKDRSQLEGEARVRERSRGSTITILNGCIQLIFHSE